MKAYIVIMLLCFNSHAKCLGSLQLQDNKYLMDVDLVKELKEWNILALCHMS